MVAIWGVGVGNGGKVGDCRVATLLAMTVGVATGGKVAMVAFVLQAMAARRMVASSGRRLMLVAPR